MDRNIRSAILEALLFVYTSRLFLTDLKYILIDKLNSKDFPHEIGIFLGYPLKDVVGFMGYGNYKFYKTKYWKIYGDPEISDIVYNNFLKDRKAMRHIISSETLEELRTVV